MNQAAPGLLATKLRPPAAPPARVPRPRLLERLDRGLALGRTLTLVSAPAGFGKTTCVAAWVAGLDRPVTWLALDGADDDPLRFFTYLLAALHRVDATLAQPLAGLLRAGQLPPGEVISTTLINALVAQTAPFVLVLDDLHVLQDPRILDVLEQLVTHVPPSLHLVLVTREDPPLPLARLRAHNAVTEIRAADLRFTEPEAEAFLNDVMALSLTAAEIAALETRTEGWVVGLQLAGLSLRGRADAAAFIARLSGSHRFILSYLTEEVLAHQPEAVKRFLLQTSILDRLSGPLCDAVTGRTDGAALLDHLLAANLFLIPLDDEGRWYRYHPLFADLLRDRRDTLPADEVTELHRRAARWTIDARDDPALRLGEREALIDAGIRHALAAGDYALCLAQIEQHAMAMLAQWHLKMVEGWMAALPPAWSARSARANLAFAWTHLMHGDVARAAPYLERLQGVFADPEKHAADPTATAQWLALQAMLATGQGGAAQGLALAERALAAAPEQDAVTRSLVVAELARARQQLGDVEGARAAYDHLIRLGQATGNLAFELLGRSALGLLALNRGELHAAYDTASEGIAQMVRAGALPPIGIGLYGEVGQVAFQWHRLDEAHRCFRQAIELGALSGFGDAEAYHGVVLSRLHLIEGDADAAARVLADGVRLARATALAAVREEVVAQQVRVALAQDDLAAAERALQEGAPVLARALAQPAPEADPDLTYTRGLLTTSALRILLHRGAARHSDADLQRGLALAGSLIAAATAHGYLPIVLEALLVRAGLHAARGDRVRCGADVARALALGEPEGFITPFLAEGAVIAQAVAEAVADRGAPGPVQPAYVRQILDALGPAAGEADAAASASPALIEPLTDRELDVLRLVAGGLKYREIADRLFISLNTVRTHVKAIYGKLGVNNRTQAIETATRLHLLQS